jgi:hypothetical protein
MYKKNRMDEFLEAYLGIYEESELEKRAKKNKEALDTGFMQMSDDERTKESKRLDNLAKRESSRMREDYSNLVLDYLVSEGYADNYDSAAGILEAMSDEWLAGILSEAPFDIYRGNTTIDDTKVGSSEPVKVNKKPYKTRKGANRTADKLNQDYGANIYSVRKISEQ